MPGGDCQSINFSSQVVDLLETGSETSVECLRHRGTLQICDFKADEQSHLQAVHSSSQSGKALKNLTQLSFVKLPAVIVMVPHILICTL